VIARDRKSKSAPRRRGDTEKSVGTLLWGYPLSYMAADRYSKTALAVGALKDGLLYFDHVVPLTGAIEVGIAYRSIVQGQSVADKAGVAAEMLAKILIEYLPPELNDIQFIQRLVAFHDFFWKSFQTSRKDPIAGRAELIEAMERVRAFAREYRLIGLPICTIPSNVEPSEEASDIALSIATLRLIDTENISYQQLVELRKDAETKEKLRRLRLFAYENYKGKPRSFIEDDLMGRIADYDLAVAKWGFETKTAVLTALLDSKLLAGGVAGSFLSAYLNEPLLAVASGIGATGLAIGRVAVEIGKKRFELQKAMSDSPVSYIAFVKKKLQEAKNK
jgi:hypothetical protein